MAALSLGLAIPASATTVTLGGTAPAGYVSTTFGSTLAASTGGTWTGTTGAATANTSTNSYTDPLNGPGYYAYAEADSAVKVNFASAIFGLDLLWGSPDSYNTLTLFSGANETGSSVALTPGTGLLSGLAPVQTGATMVDVTGGSWRSASFSSGNNSFEFAEVSTLAPEPGSIALLGAGLLAIGVIRRRKSA